MEERNSHASLRRVHPGGQLPREPRRRRAVPFDPAACGDRDIVHAAPGHDRHAVERRKQRSMEELEIL